MFSKSLSIFFVLILIHFIAYTQTSFTSQGGSGYRNTSYEYGQSYSVSAGSSNWLTVNLGRLKLSWTVAPNTTYAPRTSTITTTEKTSQGNFVSVQVNITQAAAERTPPTSRLLDCKSFTVSGPRYTEANKTYYTFYATTQPANTVYNWTVSSGYITYGQGTQTINVYLSPSITVPVTVRATTTNLDYDNSCSAEFIIETR